MNHSQKMKLSPLPFSTLILGLALAPVSPTLASDGVIAHEWGTFTSVQGSDGSVQEGLQHEEEGLPSFVYGRDLLHTRLENTSLLVDAPKPTPTPHEPQHPPRPHGPQKAMEVSLESDTETAVTQKMETPVIYFYSPEATHVDVDVKFPRGIISQWYPNVTSFSPALGAVKKLANGNTHWSVDILDHPTDLPAVPPQDIWAPSRKVNSNFLSFHGENEKFIFYRGLGKFTVPFQVVSQDKAFKLNNLSDQKIPQAFLIRVEAGQGAIQSLGSVGAHSSLVAPFSQIPAFEKNWNQYLNHVAALLEKALVESGLFQDEAKAMVDTWSKSYFKTPGTRILYILPRAWTDQILPIQISPAPKSLVRTLVGRVEILSQQEEHQIEADLIQIQATPAAKLEAGLLARLGRFAEPKLRRVVHSSNSPRVKSAGLKMIGELN